MFYILSIGMVLVVKVTTILSSSQIQAAQCVPSNNMLWTPIQPLYNQLTGAVGGLVFPLAIAVLLIAGFGGIIGALRNQDMSKFIRIIMAVAGIVFGLIGSILILSAIYAGANNLC